jgi:hypothetical protein
MKPLNLDNRPCSPVSSNCIVWQGPDISCINICTGDTISDVVAALATELCTLLDQTNVNNYDLACLGIGCGPKDFQALIQLLINKICELNGITPDTVKSTEGCPDCIVDIADCFRTGGNTTMQLLDYVQMIAEKVCALIDEINALQIQINNLDIRVTVLENTPPPTFTLPSILVDCTLTEGVIVGGSSYTIDLVLNALLNDNINGYCSLIDATGLPADLFSAVSSQCITSTTITLSNPPVPYGTEYLGTWVNSPETVADAINNIWIVLCDYYDYLQDNLFTVEDTNTVNLNYSGGIFQANVQDTGWVRLLGFSFIPDSNTQGVPMVRRIGNVLHFRGTVIVPLINGASPLTWNYSAGVDSYFLNTTTLPFTGVGGVTISTSGSVIFNNGNSVIPVSVLPAGYMIDGRYQNPAGWKSAHRAIPIDGTNSTILTTFFSQVIATTGILALGMIKDLESSTISGSGGAGSWDTSPFNNIISHVRSGELVPNYNSSASTIHSSPNNGSTDTVTLPAPLAPDTQYLNNLSQFYTTGYTYPFSCNANDQDQIGGFFQRLDGLTAFISKCGTLIATPPPC